MTYLNDEALDQGLDWVDVNGTRIDICHTEPTTYAEATSTYTLGNKTGLNTGATQNGDASGRKVIVPAITDGTVTGSGTAAFWALTDGATLLVATNDLASTQVVTSGNSFTLAAIDITIPDPA